MVLSEWNVLGDLKEVIARIQPYSDQWRRGAVKIRQLRADALQMPDRPDYARFSSGGLYNSRVRCLRQTAEEGRRRAWRTWIASLIRLISSKPVMTAIVSNERR